MPDLLGTTETETREWLRDIAAQASTPFERTEGDYEATSRESSSGTDPSWIDGAKPASLTCWCDSVAGGDWSRFRRRLSRDNINLDELRPLAASPTLKEGSALPSWLPDFVDAFGWMTGRSRPPDSLSRPDRARRPKPLPGPAPSPFVSSRAPVAFEELIVPAVAGAYGRLARGRPGVRRLTWEARAETGRWLLRSLASILAPAMALEFEAFRAAHEPPVRRMRRRASRMHEGQGARSLYLAFVAHLRNGGLREFFGEYPVLARLVGTLTRQWITTTDEFLGRLDRDWENLVKAFGDGTSPGVVDHIRWGLSDRHDGGRTVAALHFVSGLQVVYKPRTVGLEAEWARLLAWLRERGSPLELRSARVVERPGYGWVEFIECADCSTVEDAARYFCRAGALLCLAHALGGTDFHSENLVAVGDQPILVDLETILGPGARQPTADATARETAMVLIRESVCGTCLLPRWVSAPSGDCIDVTGLGAFGTQTVPRPALRWDNVNTDDLAVHLDRVTFHPRSNVPTVRGVPEAPGDHLEELLSGFEQTYRFLVSRRQALLADDGPIASFAVHEVRHLVRPTWHYAVVSAARLPPECLRDGVRWTAALDSRNIGLTQDSAVWTLVNAERKAEVQLDVPLFRLSAAGTALRCEGGAQDGPHQRVNAGPAEVGDPFGGYISESPLSRSLRRIREMNEADLTLQLTLTKGAFAARCVSHSHGEEAACPDRQQHSIVEGQLRSVSGHQSVAPNGLGVRSEENGPLVAHALELGEMVRASAIRSPGGTATWISMTRLPASDRLQIDVVSEDLYGGRSGIALSLAALHRVTGDYRFAEAARAALRELAAPDQAVGDRLARSIGIGGTSGAASVAYALGLTGVFLGDMEVIERAVRIGSAITSELLAGDDHLDVVGGAGGAILSLLALHKMATAASLPSSALVDTAIEAADHLLTRRKAAAGGPRAWPSHMGDGTMLCGFAHGASGIACALGRLYQVSGSRRLANAAVEALEYESLLLRPRVFLDT